MHAWEAVQKTINHIEEHIGEEIQIEELAEIAALSLFYYQRLFARLVKKPVREYIKLRRLARACEALQDKGNRIVDVAMEYGFSGHETFTRAFKSTYGITPAAYRDSRVRLVSFHKPDLLLGYVMIDEGVPLISDGLVLEMSRRVTDAPAYFLGVEGFFPFKKGTMYGEGAGVDIFDRIWQRFFKELENIPRIPGGRNIAVTYHGDAPDGYTTHFIGAEAERGAERAELVGWELPAREYVVCGFEAETLAELTTSALGRAMKYTRFWLRNHGLIADDFFPEIYYPSSSGVPYMELCIPFRKR